MNGSNLYRDPTDTRDARRGESVLPCEAEQRFATSAEMHHHVAVPAKDGLTELMPTQEPSRVLNREK